MCCFGKKQQHCATKLRKIFCALCALQTNLINLHFSTTNVPCHSESYLCEGQFHLDFFIDRHGRKLLLTEQLTAKVNIWQQFTFVQDYDSHPVCGQLKQSPAGEKNHCAYEE